MARYKDIETDELSYVEQQKMCSSKKKYKSSEAGKMARIFKQRKYLCPLCGQWHLTTKGVK